MPGRPGFASSVSSRTMTRCEGSGSKTPMSETEAVTVYRFVLRCNVRELQVLDLLALGLHQNRPGKSRKARRFRSQAVFPTVHPGNAETALRIRGGLTLRRVRASLQSNARTWNGSPLGIGETSIESSRCNGHRTESAHEGQQHKEAEPSCAERSSRDIAIPKSHRVIGPLQKQIGQLRLAEHISSTAFAIGKRCFRAISCSVDLKQPVSFPM